jgi:diaminopimelate epimerase
MKKIPFTKAHGAKNDFLLTWAADVPDIALDQMARAICDRHTGIGADGWMLMRPSGGGKEHASIQLFNSDGSTSDISGNGTRCVAALLVHSGVASGDEVRIQTQAGVKTLRRTASDGLAYRFEMDMGLPAYNEEEVRHIFSAGADKLDVTLLNVGNPQCVVFVEDLGLDWRRLGALIERHPTFPNRTNVSFVRGLDRHSIEVRFWERGAGETMSSGTGSTGAAFAAILRGMAESPVNVVTPAGELNFRLADGTAYLSGPAELIGEGEYFVRE